MPSNRILKGFIAAPSAAVILYAAAWLGSAFILKAQAENWIAAQQQAGRTITHGALVFGGFPGRAQITISDWAMSAPMADGGWSWRAPSVRLLARPWAPNTFTVDLAGEHTVAGAWTPPDVAVAIKADRADFQPKLNANGQVAEVMVAVSKLSVGDAIASLEAGSASITQIENQNTPTWRLNLDATNTKILSTAIPTARLTVDLVGEIRSGGLTTALTAWREGGGTLEVRDLTLDWPPLSVSGSGTLALDEKLQPIGALTAKFRGFFETLDAFTAQGLVRTADASMARIVLGLMSRTPAGGGPPELNLAVTVQNQKLYTGPISLMAVPTVTWPESIALP